MGTESRSGNHGHFLFAKQSMTKVHLVQTGVFNGRKGIERTPREVTGQAHFIEPANDEVTTPEILLLHALDFIGTSGQSLYGRFLAENGAHIMQYW